MAEGRSEDFQAHFCGTHFFNPPRYLRLLEVIPTTDTNSEVIDFLLNYGDVFLGKQTVLCKDTPAFIANRVGVFSIAAVIKLMQEMDMTVDEVHAIYRQILPASLSLLHSALTDVVGLDTVVPKGNVREPMTISLNDEMRDVMQVPALVMTMNDIQMVGP
jgi:3-hydroxyacyl-CoA dehydrogenase